MLLCKMCLSPVHVSTINVLAPVAGCHVTPKGIVVQRVEIIQFADSGKTEFYCTCCCRPLTQDDILVRCSHCSELFTIKQCVMPTEGGPMYCETHGKQLFKKVMSLPVDKLFIK